MPMKLYFFHQTCSSCGAKFDAKLSSCPHCHENSANHEHLKRFDRQIHLSPWMEIVFFCIGYVGFQILGLIVALATQIAYGSSHTSEELKAFIKTPEYSLIITPTVYFLTFIIIAFVLWKNWKQIGQSFLTVLVLIGVAAVIANYVGSILNSIIVTSIFNGLGMKLPEGTGSNQSTINDMVRTNPTLVFFVICLIAPFCEEIAYRVGLFNFATRFGKIIGYFITIAFFASIHLNWELLFSRPSTAEEIAKFQLEIISIPSYILGGLVLTLAYDFGGFGASLSAHCIINLISFITILVTPEKVEASNFIINKILF